MRNAVVLPRPLPPMMAMPPSCGCRTTSWKRAPSSPRANGTQSRATHAPSPQATRAGRGAVNSGSAGRAPWKRHAMPMAAVMDRASAGAQLRMGVTVTPSLL